MTQILDTAKNIVTGDRKDAYGDIDENAQTVATLLSANLPGDYSKADYPLIMICVKLARLKGTKADWDSCVDIAGYIQLYWDLVKEREG